MSALTVLIAAVHHAVALPVSIETPMACVCWRVNVQVSITMPSSQPQTLLFVMSWWSELKSRNLITMITNYQMISYIFFFSDVKPPTKKCGKNEVFSPCKINCPPQICDTLFASYACFAPDDCRESGCNCKKGYLRNGTATDPCIPISQCKPLNPITNRKFLYQSNKETVYKM